jgi:hypothetical protein
MEDAGRMWHDAARIFLTPLATNAHLACLTKILPIHNNFIQHA